MKLKRQSLVSHSIKMLFRNRRSYILLSFTIVLSFAVLLGFLVYTDTISYNKYKGIYSSPRNALTVNWPDYGTYNLRASAFMSAAEKIDPSMEYYTYYEVSVQLFQYSPSLYLTPVILPDGNPPILVEACNENPTGPKYSGNAYFYIHPIEIIQGKGEFSGNEAIINESYFNLLSPDHELPFTLDLPVENSNGSLYGMMDIVQVEIVGVFKDTYNDLEPTIDEDGRLTGDGTMFCSHSCFSDETYEWLISFVNTEVLIATDKPQEIAMLAREMMLPMRSAAQMRMQADEAMRNTSNTKMYVSMMLFAILGINLFGCFENALSERKFEIGVKRALGASNFDIILQFLTESCLVIVVDILVSIALISSLMTCYKLYLLLTYDTVLTIHISSYSAAMFGVCSLSMTLLFSALFAYRATRVEIVQYLKCE